MIVVGIETSCDETGVGVVRHDGAAPELLANEVASSVDEHARFGGVVPEVASRAHLQAMVPAVRRALATAGVTARDVDAVANGLDVEGHGPAEGVRDQRGRRREFQLHCFRDIRRVLAQRDLRGDSHRSTRAEACHRARRASSSQSSTRASARSSTPERALFSAQGEPEVPRRLTACAAMLCSAASRSSQLSP